MTNATSSPDANTTIPLFVDLDGTLIKSDMFQEALLLAIKRNPFIIFLFPFYLMRGLAYFKREISKQVVPDVKALPVQQEVIEILKQQKSLGRPAILATASDRSWADAFAAQYPLFDNVMASDGVTNLKSKNKLAGIRQFCKERGWSQFEYWGDSHADLAIWSAEDSAAVFAVAPVPTVELAIKKINKPTRIVRTGSSKLRAVIRAMRPQQWVKNLLLFIPLLLSHEINDRSKILHGMIGFISFSLCASAVYVLNDLFDAPSDRYHPEKRRRPFASGALRLSWGPFLSLTLFALSFIVALVFLPWGPELKIAPRFFLLLMVYGITNLLYSLSLKRRMVIDVILLAAMYTLRILIGGVVVGVPVSEWLLAFSIFFFTSLAFAKRHAELSRNSEEYGEKAPGRGYGIRDLGIIESIGATSGYISVLVLALYINQSPKFKLLYKSQFIMWLICPVVMYWITRLWFIAKRNELVDDPIVFAIKDRISWYTAFAILLLGVCAATLNTNAILNFLGL